MVRITPCLFGLYRCENVSHPRQQSTLLWLQRLLLSLTYQCDASTDSSPAHAYAGIEDVLLHPCVQSETFAIVPRPVPMLGTFPGCASGLCQQNIQGMLARAATSLAKIMVVDSHLRFVLSFDILA